MKLLFEFFPIILFFAAFKMYGIYVATGVAIAASILQVGWAYFRRRKVEPMLWISLAVLVVFGGSTILLHNELFIKWKPSILYWIFAAALLVSQLSFKKNLIKAMLGKQITVPEPLWNKLNYAWAVFFTFIGFLNIYIAYNYSTSIWVNFKLFGIMGFMFAFIVVQSIFLAPHISEKDK
jgi:intracellular septation protein